MYQIAWSADSRMVVSGSKDSTLKVWSVRTKKLELDLPGHADEVFAVDWSPMGTKAASGGRTRCFGSGVTRVTKFVFSVRCLFQNRPLTRFLVSHHVVESCQESCHDFQTTNAVRGEIVPRFVSNFVVKLVAGCWCAFARNNLRDLRLLCADNTKHSPT